MSKKNPFDYITAINQTKEHLMIGTNNDEIAEKEYQPFLTNRTLSYHNDTVFYANEMNRMHQLPNRLQYDFLLNTVRKRKRFAKWSKKGSNDDLKVVKEYYGYNDSKAVQALSILSDDHLKYIRARLDKGGKK